MAQRVQSKSWLLLLAECIGKVEPTSFVGEIGVERHSICMSKSCACFAQLFSSTYLIV